MGTRPISLIAPGSSPGADYRSGTTMKKAGYRPAFSFPPGLRRLAIKRACDGAK